jgi:hypothetical protein
MTETVTSPSPEPDTALLPLHVRRVVVTVAVALVMFGVYLFAVRGPAMMLDLAQAAYNMFCL